MDKSRLVVQAYGDEEKYTVMTAALTLTRSGQRIVLLIAAIMIETTKVYLRDITQAYVQAVTSLNCLFFITPSLELAKALDVRPGFTIKVIKALYSVLEAGNY